MSTAPDAAPGWVRALNAIATGWGYVAFVVVLALPLSIFVSPFVGLPVGLLVAVVLCHIVFPALVRRAGFAWHGPSMR